MKSDMIDLIEKLETCATWPCRPGANPPYYTSTIKEAIVRLIAMDAQIIKLQAKADIYQARASDASYAEDELQARNERERLSGNNYGGL